MLQTLEYQRAQASAKADQAFAEVNKPGAKHSVSELNDLLAVAFEKDSKVGVAFLVFAYLINMMYAAKPVMWAHIINTGMQDKETAGLYFQALICAWSYGLDNFGPCKFTD